MRTVRFMVSAVVLSILVISFGAGSAMADEGCAAATIRTRAAELGGMTVTGFKSISQGILLTVKNPAKEGVVMVGMAAVEPDLVTFQSVWGREGASTLDQAESAWLGRLFDKLYPDATFRACPDLKRPAAPNSDEMFAAMQAWWKEQSVKDVQSSEQDPLLTIVVVGAAALFVIAVILFVIFRARKARKAVSTDGSTHGSTHGSTKTVSEQPEPRAETPGDEPTSSDDEEQEEVL